MTDSKEKELEKAVFDCVLESSWKYCVIGLGLAVPLGVKFKSYSPLVYLGLAGTGLDLYTGYTKCEAQRLALEAYKKGVGAEVLRQRQQ
ncbi:hypothetical protein WJX72_011894 [[Myrmecia] bisecta]|uniref:DUF2892 domain-containing protein n=1 Tax=[Myrmecia] bisecta TaxID=41462 RepID=A0AAW1PYC3_9CHLO